MPSAAGGCDRDQVKTRRRRQLNAGSPLVGRQASRRDLKTTIRIRDFMAGCRRKWRIEMRRSSFIMLWLALGLALFPALCGAQDKTLIVRPLADAPPIVKRALVIGVNSYKHANALPETINDAQRFAELLRTRFGFPDDAVTVMTDAPGTKEELLPTYT